MLQRIALLFCLIFSPLLWAQPVIDLNTASVQELVQLDGIGEKKAEAIVQYRDRVGPFTSVDQLTNVKGIGSVTLEKNRPLLVVGSSDDQYPEEAE